MNSILKVKNLKKSYQDKVIFEKISFDEPVITSHDIENIDALQAEVNHFVDCVINNTAPMVTGADGMAALEVALAVSNRYRSPEPVI